VGEVLHLCKKNLNLPRFIHLYSSGIVLPENTFTDREVTYLCPTDDPLSR